MPRTLQYRPTLIDELISNERINSYQNVFQPASDIELMGVPGVAGRAVVLRIEPPAASRPLRASIADAYGPDSRSGPARFACVRSAHRDGRCLGHRLS